MRWIVPALLATFAACGDIELVIEMEELYCVVCEAPDQGVPTVVGQVSIRQEAQSWRAIRVPNNGPVRLVPTMSEPPEPEPHGDTYPFGPGTSEVFDVEVIECFGEERFTLYIPVFDDEYHDVGMIEVVVKRVSGTPEPDPGDDDPGGGDALSGETLLPVDVRQIVDTAGDPVEGVPFDLFAADGSTVRESRSDVHGTLHTPLTGVTLADRNRTIIMPVPVALEYAIRRHIYYRDPTDHTPTDVPVDGNGMVTTETVVENADAPGARLTVAADTVITDDGLLVTDNARVLMFPVPSEQIPHAPPADVSFYGGCLVYGALGFSSRQHLEYDTNRLLETPAPGSTVRVFHYDLERARWNWTSVARTDPNGVIVSGDLVDRSGWYAFGSAPALTRKTVEITVTNNGERVKNFWAHLDEGPGASARNGRVLIFPGIDDAAWTSRAHISSPHWDGVVVTPVVPPYNVHVENAFSRRDVLHTVRVQDNGVPQAVSVQVSSNGTTRTIDTVDGYGTTRLPAGETIYVSDTQHRVVLFAGSTEHKSVVMQTVPDVGPDRATVAGRYRYALADTVETPAVGAEVLVEDAAGRVLRFTMPSSGAIADLALTLPCGRVVCTAPLPAIDGTNPLVQTIIHEPESDHIKIVLDAPPDDAVPCRAPQVEVQCEVLGANKARFVSQLGNTELLHILANPQCPADTVCADRLLAMSAARTALENGFEVATHGFLLDGFREPDFAWTIDLDAEPGTFAFDRNILITLIASPDPIDFAYLVTHGPTSGTHSFPVNNPAIAGNASTVFVPTAVPTGAHGGLRARRVQPFFLNPRIEVEHFHPHPPDAWMPRLEHTHPTIEFHADTIAIANPGTAVYRMEERSGGKCAVHLFRATGDPVAIPYAVTEPGAAVAVGLAAGGFELSVGERQQLFGTEDPPWQRLVTPYHHLKGRNVPLPEPVQVDFDVFFEDNDFDIGPRFSAEHLSIRTFHEGARP